MYRVTVYNDGEATVIHESGADPSEPHLYSCVLTQGCSGEIDSLQFIILPNNPGYDLLSSRLTMVEVLNTKTEALEFSGRVLTITPEMEESGLIYKTIVCEDRLGYLCDSVQPYLEKTTYYDDGENTGVEQFLDLVLENHNSQVEDYKKIYRGTVTFTTNTDNVTKGLTYETTWETITQKLLEDLGGEIQLREGDDGLLYLDYVTELGDVIDADSSGISIAFGKNMRSVSREIDPTSVITRLIPLGSHIDSDDGDSNDYVTIASVNDDVLYIDDKSAQETYGIVAGTVTWEDVTEPSNLLTKATTWLEQQTLTDIITISALDLSLIGLADDALERYNYYNVVNDMVGLNTYYRVIRKTINICEPSDITFELGDRSRSLASTIISTQQTAKKESTARADAITNLANKLNSSSGLFITTAKEDDGSSIYYMHNKSTLADSDIVWKITAEAFGISTDGGDTYPFGFDVSGNVIAERLYAVGIDATYITTGALAIKDDDGNVIFCADVENQLLTINTKQLVLDSSGNGTFSGTLNAASGTFNGTLTTENGNYKTIVGYGYISCYYDGSLYGRITAIYSSSVATYFSLLGDSDNCGAVSIGIGNTGYIFVNNGADPNGYEERVQIVGTSRFTDIINCTAISASGNYIFTNTHGVMATDSSGSETFVLSMSSDDWVNVGSADYTTNIRGSSINLATTISSNVNVVRSGTTEARVSVSNDSGTGYLVVNASGSFGLYDYSHSYWLTSSSSDGYGTFRVSSSYYLSYLSNGGVYCNGRFSTASTLWVGNTYYGGSESAYMFTVNGASYLNGNLVVVGSIQGHQGIELYHSTPYIDFHFGSSSADYTSRIIESSSGVLTITGSLAVSSALTVTSTTRLNGNNYLAGATFSAGAVFNDYVTISGALTANGTASFPGVTEAGTSASYAMLSASERVLRYGASSSERYKIVSDELTEDDIMPLYDIQTYWFKYKDGYLAKDDERCGKSMPGFIVERWEDVLPIAVNHDSDGLPEMWNNNIIVPLMFEMIKYNHSEIESIKALIADLQNQLNQLQASA